MKTLFAAVLALSCVATQALADVVVIGNPAGPDSISASQVRDIYLNRSQQLPDGQKAVPFELQSGNPARADFHGKITNRNDAQLKAFWSQQVFTGRGQPPQELANAGAVKNSVASTPGGIGYIDAAEVDDTVKVILTP